MKTISIIAITLLLTSCATDIMNDYIGKPISAMIPAYGMPTSSYEIDKDKRAFVWQKNIDQIREGYSNTQSTFNDNKIFSDTYTRPAYVTTNQCNYVMFATRTRTDITGPAAWTITGFQKPPFSCSFGLR